MSGHMTTTVYHYLDTCGGLTYHMAIKKENRKIIIQFHHLFRLRKKELAGSLKFSGLHRVERLN